MFKEPTVLVLGAGASNCHGFPTGNELKKRIIKSIDNFVEVLPNVSVLFDERAEKYNYELPIARQLFFASQERQIDVSEQLLQTTFHNHFKKQLQDETDLFSIDEFVHNNRSFHDIARLYTAAMIYRFAYGFNFNEKRYELNTEILNGYAERDATTSVETNLGWYNRLVNELKNDCEDSADLKRNQLNIVTFNYDNSLEHFLQARLFSSERFEEIPLDQVVRITHMYGALPLHKETMFQRTQDTFPNLVLDNFRNILLMFEKRQTDNSRSAEQTIRNAEKAIFAGYGFHDRNNDLLELDSNLKDKIVISTLTKDDERARIKLSSRWTVPNQQIRISSIAQAVDDGIFGDDMRERTRNSKQI